MSKKLVASDDESEEIRQDLSKPILGKSKSEPNKYPQDDF